MRKVTKTLTPCKLLTLLLCAALSTATASAQESAPPAPSGFADTTGGYGYMYLSTTCFDCNPKGLVFYKKFVLVSGFYKTKDFYSAVATRSVDHFQGKYTAQGFFVDKRTEIWKSPHLFASLEEAREYRDELISKLKKDDYKVIVFDDFINPETLKSAD